MVATPGVLRPTTRPPCRSTIALTIDSPSPVPAAGPRRVGLVEAIEDVRQVLGRDAGAVSVTRSTT